MNDDDDEKRRGFTTHCGVCVCVCVATVASTTGLCGSRSDLYSGLAIDSYPLNLDLILGYFGPSWCIVGENN